MTSEVPSDGGSPGIQEVDFALEILGRVAQGAVEVDTVGPRREMIEYCPVELILVTKELSANFIVHALDARIQKDQSQVPAQ